MKVLVTGSRSWDDDVYIERTLEAAVRDASALVLFHGACPEGADLIADRWARRRQRAGGDVLIVAHPAQWGRFGKRAGMVRNSAMVKAFGDDGGGLCLAFIRDNSSGATKCALLAEKDARINVIRHRWEDR